MEEVTRASVKTELKLGVVSEPVALFKTKASEKGARKWDSAGPDGGPLRNEMRAVDAEPGETPDALGITPVKEDEPPPPTLEDPVEDPGPEGAPLGEVEQQEAEDRLRSGVSTPAETKQVLVEEGTKAEDGLPVVVEPEDVRKGIRLDDGEFVDMTKQLEAAEEESRTEGLEVLGFIRRERVPRERVVDSYFLAGDKKTGMRLIRILSESMQEAGRVAVVRWTKRKGQSLGILLARGDGAMIVLEIAFAEVCRAPNAKCLAHRRAEVKRSEVDAAVALLKQMEWKPGQLDEVRNRRVELEEELIEKAETGKIEDYEVKAPTVEPQLEDLAALLERSAA